MKHYTLKSSHQTLPDTFGNTLNHAQQQAVFFNDGPLLLIAGAGSGKTKTIVHRVARLINDGTPPNQILLLTFTRKSANEMLTRASQLLDDRCHHVAGGTFHSFANTTLRYYASAIGYPSNFTIMDRSDAEDLIQLLRKENNLGRTDKRFPKKGTLTTIISKAINTQHPIDQIIAQDYPQFIDFIAEIKQLSKNYHTKKYQMKLMDYDDLLTKLIELLHTHTTIQSELQHHYRYIMVDEYQDTNTIQDEIITSITNANQNIMVVGDDCQSIYSFRGANYRNIMDFPQKYPSAEIITLTENYRSTQPILDLTNEMILHAHEKFSKTLTSSQQSKQKPIYIETPNDNTQSRFICQKILEIREETNTSLNDIAILMRSGWHSNDLELELKGHQIPFIKQGGFKFIESAHIKDIIALLKLTFNPADQLSWQRILVLCEGLGSTSANQIIADIIQNLHTPQSFPFNNYKTKKYKDDLAQLLDLIFKNWDQTLPAKILDELLLFYTPLFKLTYDDYTKRQTDIDALTTIIKRFKSLETLLTEMSLDPPSSTEATHQPHDNERLTLSTIHSAKGLEWHTVFILSCVDGYIPSFQSLGEKAQLEEERRLLYVALTRAKQNLFIIKPHLDLSQSHYYRYSGMHFSKLSRFLSDHTSINSLIEQWVLDEDIINQKNEITPELDHINQEIPTENNKSEPHPKSTQNKKKYYF